MSSKQFQFFLSPILKQWLDSDTPIVLHCTVHGPGINERGLMDEVQSLHFKSLFAQNRNTKMLKINFSSTTVYKRHPKLVFWGIFRTILSVAPLDMFQ